MHHTHRFRKRAWERGRNYFACPMEVAFPSLDRIEFFSPAAEGYRRAVAGDLAPFSERPLANRNFVFPLRVAPGAPQTFFLRVASA